MAVKVTVVSPAKNRVSINKQERTEVKTVGISAVNKLSGLSDVDATDPDNNETLVYDAASGKYVIKELPIVNGGTF